MIKPKNGNNTIDKNIRKNKYNLINVCGCSIDIQLYRISQVIIVGCFSIKAKNSL